MNRSEWALDFLNVKHLPEYLGGGFLDADLPPQLTGELVPKEGKQMFIERTILARTFYETNVGIPSANTDIEIKALVKYYGINVEVHMFFITQ